jgi:hypothetical protein
LFNALVMLDVAWLNKFNNSSDTIIVALLVWRKTFPPLRCASPFLDYQCIARSFPAGQPVADSMLPSMTPAQMA